MPLIRCPECGEHEALRGVEHDKAGLLVECTGCGHRWERDLTLRCGRCGSEELDPVLTTTLEEAGRGEQRTPSGLRRTYRCRSCGARNATSSSPRPPDPDPGEDRRIRPERATRRSAPAAEPRAKHRVDSAFGSFEVGAVVGGRWQLRSLVRWSASGSLWAAAERDGPRRVMFLLVHPAETQDASRRRAYVASARAVGRVEHPGLLAVHDVREREGDVLIVGELAGTRTLADLPEVDLSGVDLPAVGAGIAGALAALHAAGLAHLRVRPGGILIPEGGSARLLDFGIGRARASLRAPQSDDDDLTWMAPEQLVGRDHGPAADVYSLALSLWVAAGGSLERLGATPSGRVQSRLGGDLPPLEEAPDPRLADAIAVAGRRDPAARVSAGDLAAILTGE